MKAPTPGESDVQHREQPPNSTGHLGRPGHPSSTRQAIQAPCGAQQRSRNWASLQAFIGKICSQEIKASVSTTIFGEIDPIGAFISRQSLAWHRVDRPAKNLFL